MSGALFGSLGRMIEFFPWEEEQTVKTKRSISVHDTIGGGSFAFRGRRTRRTWSLKNEDLSPEEYRDIELMLYDSEGSGPFWLIDQEARATNALTPGQSMPGLHGETPGMLGDVSAGATVLLPGGFRAPSALSGGGTVYFRHDCPVIPGETITCSMYGSSGANVVVNYTDSLGSYLSSGGKMLPVSDSLGGSQRFSRTLVVPPNASAVYFSVSGARMLAAPSLTYSSEVFPWSVGKGCNSAVVSSWSRSFDRMDPDHVDRQLVSVSIEVEEVGVSA